jgi:hypothetical protein
MASSPGVAGSSRAETTQDYLSFGVMFESPDDSIRLEMAAYCANAARALVHNGWKADVHVIAMFNANLSSAPDPVGIGIDRKKANEDFALF